MGDRVGASPQAMAEAVTNFNTRYNEFITAAKNITSDTLALQAAWQGQGYNEFTNAMGKWNTDINNVTTDLQSMSLGVQNSSSAIQTTDSNIARAFRGFNG